MTDYEQAYRDLRAGVEALADHLASRGCDSSDLTHPHDPTSYRSAVCPECLSVDLAALLASSAPATASEGARGLGVSVAASELRRLNRIGETRRDLISDEDWMWFCNHPLRLAHEHPIGWSAALGPVADWLDGITGVTSSDGDRGLSEEELDALLHWLHGGAAGGIQSLWAMVERILAARTAQLEGVERVEWSTWVAREQRGYDDRADAQRRAERDGSAVVRRTVTEYAPDVSEWEVVGDE